MIQTIRSILLFLVGATLPLQELGGFQVGSYPVGPNKTATAVLLVFALVSAPLAGRGVPWNRKHPWVLAFALAFLVGSLHSLSQGFEASRLYVLWTSFLAVLIFSFLIPHAVASRAELHALLVGLIAGGVLAVLGGLPGGDRFSGGRFIGTTGNPNDLAGSLALAVPLAFGFLLSVRSRFRKMLLIVAIGICVAGIVATLSRSAFLSLVAMWLLWVVRFRRIDTLRYVAPTLVLALAVVWLAPQAFRARIGTISTESDDLSIQVRFRTNYWGFRALLSNPFIGVGVARSPEFAQGHDPTLGAHVIHHAFLAVGAEFGLLGLLPMLMFTILTWADFSRVRRVGSARELRDDPEIAALFLWATFLQIAYLGFLVGAQFHPSQLTKAFWMLIGLSSALAAMARARVRVLQASDAALDRPLASREPPMTWEPRAVGSGSR